jgi:hypothetical protein
MIQVREEDRELYDALYELDKAKIWGGTGWHYNPLPPRYYRKAVELIENYLKEKYS